MRTEHVLHPTDFNQPPVKTTRDIVHCGPFRTTKQITTPTVVQKKDIPVRHLNRCVQSGGACALSIAFFATMPAAA